MELPEFLLARISEDEIGASYQGHYSARVLAECDAKRRIVEQWRVIDAEWLVKRHRREFDMDSAEEAMWTVLKLLALPYADHPGYRAEWKP